ncbi:putative atp-dependent RNA helicase [Schistosoma mansoni]|uniref:putative atp-dependent RNA helicase n=1 Tax=Schistosoma mansoni TaxID=6183 RepID=UPI00022DC8D4|nr:putative atp-dependent RNA helicase [Schistosoma mansoni]|eukprot:XP_018651171.1 putative atp-dependent RNA helicase [Schistosoma mansoni]
MANVKRTCADLIDFEFNEAKYDSSNPLVLPGKNESRSKGKRQLDSNQIVQHQILSKKRRKELLRKVSQKEKKLSRSELWRELEEYKKSETTQHISVLPLFNKPKKSEKKLTNCNIRGKSWKQQCNDLSDISKSTDEYSSDESVSIDEAPFTPAAPEQDPTNDKVGEVTQTIVGHKHENKPLEAEKVSKPARFVLVSRTPEVVAARLALPILSDEATIMESISENDCVIICGATGCGKTTQIPQFLYEAGYAIEGYMIGITEPRRVAAISMAHRVGEELNLTSGQVSYHIRYDKEVTKETLIKFMTDGILLQEIKQDFELSKYSVIIVDEAHERSIYSDVILGLISMVVRLRRQRFTDNIPTNGKVLSPLKLIIMSATLKVDDFAENRRLFPHKPPPVIHIESRQYPVPNWLARAFPKMDDQKVNVTNERCNKTHKHQKEKKKLEESVKAPASSNSLNSTVLEEKDQFNSGIDLNNFDIIPVDEETEIGHTRINSKEVVSTKEKQSNKVTYETVDDSDIEEIGEDDDILGQINEIRNESYPGPVYALPFYSLLSPERQQSVFQPPPENHRLIVVATNVAETSITIPNIRFVVDTGKVKTKVYEPATGTSNFEIIWISQASAEQRAGRAGRIGPGHCYRLYSSQIFSSMKQFSIPDILSRPIDEVVLMLKLYLGNTKLTLFPLPTPPLPQAIEAAERRLIALGALKEITNASGGVSRTITDAGKWMTRVPVPARFARMLLFANQCQLMPYAVILVAALSVPNLFLSQDTPLSEQEKSFQSNFVQQFVRKKEDLYLGDLAVLLGTICCLERYSAQLSGLTPAEPGIIESVGGKAYVSRDPEGALRQLVHRCGVRWNAYKEVRQLRKQLTDILNVIIPDLGLSIDLCLPKPSDFQLIQLRQLFLVGSPCQIAKKLSVSVTGLPGNERRRLRYAYEIPGKQGPVFIDSNSPLARENFPFVAYLELHTTSKPFLRSVCAIDPGWIPFLAPHSYAVNELVLTDNVDTSEKKSENQSIANESNNRGSDDDEGSKSAPNTSVTSNSLVSLPTPRYDSERDIIVTGAKSITYIGLGVVPDSSTPLFDNQFLDLPSTVLVPINSVAAAQSLGFKESLTWSVRWFTRYLLEGVIFSEFKKWFPLKMKKCISPQIVTVSWGIIRPEVRSIVSLLVADKIDSKRKLLQQWESDVQCK